MESNLKKSILICSAILLAAGLVSSSLPAAEEPKGAKKKEEPKPTCKECHASLFEQKHVHSGFRKRPCESCHKISETPNVGDVADAADAGERPRRCGSGQVFTEEKGSKLCRSCHKETVLFKKHPTLDGKCRECHDPHGGDRKFNLLPGAGEYCHHKLPVGKSRHKPFVNGKCSDCHAMDDSQKGYLAKRPRGSLCSECHEGSGNLPDESFKDLCMTCHKPGAKGDVPKDKRVDPKALHVDFVDCSHCHFSHSSPNASLLRKPGRELCSTCHEPGSITVTNKKDGFVHVPAAKGDCTRCHSLHSVGDKGLLVRKGNDLCLDCHAAQTGVKDASSKRVDLSNKYVHAVIEKSTCSDCHDAHGSKYRAILKRKPATVCFQKCHTEFKERFKHSAVLLGRCSTCHDPHSAPNKHLVRVKGSALCFLCHADDVTGRVSVHTPITKGECLSCHSPHEGRNRALLKKGNGKATCLNCHGPKSENEKARLDLVLKNVHKAIELYGCEGCHDPHGSNNPDLLVENLNELCIRCHPKQKTGEHIFTNFDGTPHPVEGPEDPSAPSKKLGCGSCHLPHASDSPNLWPDGDEKGALCIKCHENTGQKGMY